MDIHNYNQNEIWAQAQALILSKWETNLIVKTCQTNHCLEKGTKILTEFTRYTNQLRLLMDKRYEYYIRVIALLSSSSTVNRIINAFEKLATVTGKLIYALCTWRKFQWNPWPIIVFGNSIDPLHRQEAPEPTISLPIFLEGQSCELFAVSMRWGEDLFSHLRIESLIIVFAPSIDLVQFTEQIESNRETLDSDNSFGERLQQAYQSIRLVMSHELRITAAWSQNAKAIQQYPIIRIPHDGIDCVHHKMDFFEDALRDYTQASKLIAGVISSLSQHSASSPASRSLRISTESAVTSLVEMR